MMTERMTIVDIEVQKVCVEESDTEKVNLLYASGEWCKPKWCDKRDTWMLVRRGKK